MGGERSVVAFAAAAAVAVVASVEGVVTVGDARRSSNSVAVVEIEYNKFVLTHIIANTTHVTVTQTLLECRLGFVEADMA